MKKLIFIMLAVALLCTSSAGAFEAIGGFGVGAIMQKTQSTEALYFMEMKAPLVTGDSGSYQIALELSTFFTDRGLNELGEMTGQRIFTTGKKRIISGLSIMLGGGTYRLTSSVGDDSEFSAIVGGVEGSVIGIEISARCDLVMLPDQFDLFIPSVSIRLLGL